MTLFQVEELTAYWAEHPPVHLLVAAYLGISKEQHQRKPPAWITQGSSADSDLTAVLAQLGVGFGPADIHTGLAPVVLDFTELQRRAESPSEQQNSLSAVRRTAWRIY